MPDYETKLAELFIDLPELAAPKGSVVHAIQVGKLLLIEGCLPYTDGKLTHRGRLGMEVTLDQGAQAARYALLQALSAIRTAAGGINKIRQVVQLAGYIASAAEFKEHDRVLEGAGQLLVQVFGAAGKHVRRAVGVTSLPQGACLSLSMIVELR